MNYITAQGMRNSIRCLTEFANSLGYGLQFSKPYTFRIVKGKRVLKVVRGWFYDHASGEILQELLKYRAKKPL